MRAKKIFIAAALLLALVGGAFGCGKSRPQNKPRRQSLKRKKARKPHDNLVYSPLDGLKAKPGLVNRQPLAVMVENLARIRPQAGIKNASVVVEGLAEGGITRFMLVYLEKGADNIGPVRSARSHFVALAKGWDAVYAHVGGSKYALVDIKRYQLDDIDQYSHGSGYHRLRSIRAPHNVFSSSRRLRNIKKVRHVKPPGFFFKADAPAAERPNNQEVKINFSYAAYAVKWVYDPESNTYKRFNGGKPHTDAGGGKQLAAKNIVIMYAPTRLIPGTPLLDITTVGSGRLQVIRDGETVNGEWRRDGVDSPLLLKDDTGENIKLNRGQVWIELVKPITPVRITTTES